MADDEQPYVDPNSGLASQPGSYAHNGIVEDDDAEDPNPDPGGAEAEFGDPADAVINAAVEHQAATVERADDPEDAEDDDELEDPNPDEGGADVVLDEDADPTHAHEVETQAAGPEGGEEPSDEDPNPDEGGAEAVLDEGNPRQAPADGTSPEEAEDAQPGADVQEQNVVEEPSKGDSRAAWVEYARTKGASEEELAEGGLKRNELADKYGTATS